MLCATLGSMLWTAVRGSFNQRALSPANKSLVGVSVQPSYCIHLQTETHRTSIHKVKDSHKLCHYCQASLRVLFDGYLWSHKVCLWTRAVLAKYTTRWVPPTVLGVDSTKSAAFILRSNSWLQRGDLHREAWSHGSHHGIRSIRSFEPKSSQPLSTTLGSGRSQVGPKHSGAEIAHEHKSLDKPLPRTKLLKLL
eukprot:5268602-Amphidinium_carterae.1